MILKDSAPVAFLCNWFVRKYVENAVGWCGRPGEGGEADPLCQLTLCVCVCGSVQVKLVQHTYSCLFGTFLCNNAKERGEKHTQERTCSVWSLLRAANKAFKNLLYSSQSESVCTPLPSCGRALGGSPKQHPPKGRSPEKHPSSGTR